MIRSTINRLKRKNLKKNDRRFHSVVYLTCFLGFYFNFQPLSAQKDLYKDSSTACKRYFWITENDLDSIKQYNYCIRHISLQVNDGQQFIDIIRSCSNLVSLRLNNLAISKYPQLSECPYLETINFSNNRIDSLNDPIFQPYLKSIELKRNLISFVNITYPNKSIERINLSDNRLSQFPLSLALIQNLQYLNLSGNEITYIPDAITNFEEMDYLDISSNPITSLPQSLAGCKKLKTVIAYNTKMSKKALKRHKKHFKRKGINLIIEKITSVT